MNHEAGPVDQLFDCLLVINIASCGKIEISFLGMGQGLVALFSYGVFLLLAFRLDPPLPWRSFLAAGLLAVRLAPLGLQCRCADVS